MKTDIERAIDAFNRGDYLAAAEAFEDSQRGAEPQLKELTGALNRIAAALHLRFERGSSRGALNLLSQALATLQDLRPERAGVDIDRLCSEISAYADELRATPHDQAEGLKRRTRLFIERRRVPKINRTI
jgi:predicted metal-dependent hydrolase